MKTPFSTSINCFLLAAALAAPAGALGQTNATTEVASPDSAAVSAYHVVPLDTITITVYNEKELTGDYLVSNEGKIRFPLIEDVNVSGLAPDEIGAKIKQLLEADYLVHAYVSVDVKTFRQRVVTVLGEVFKPGPVEFSGVKPMGLLEAIGRVGGVTLKAKTKDIIVTRQRKIIHFNYEDYKRNPKENQPPVLEDGDVVTVGQSFF